MTSRTRKLIGALIMVPFVVIYALIAMVLAQYTAMKLDSQALRFIIFAVLGLGWALPMMPLIKWMEKPDA
ncbi:hypothetical protein M2323_001997 [Rhodoblastus acidophilus]|jgi:hypothetical protein|uniref:DUF2842 domain-containing protein n=1 Tax=Rhodoblastus acidophilus TaxID=1074 RepID=UPI00160C7BC6|nr:DUF2842 domain-containing protein [Rhodoblastus acidophilus]MCW2285703.1 hypothetical protein [Rhodoblastus acidophilus]MCW2333075.1 hypothetical protein [Rhodoblastus acidophilus]